MNDSYINLCFRCGKHRIVLKTWKEKLDTSTITVTQTACPDAECQKIVDAANKKNQARQNALRQRSNQRHGHRKTS